jgi:hypothetical protein
LSLVALNHSTPIRKKQGKAAEIYHFKWWWNLLGIRGRKQPWKTLLFLRKIIVFSAKRNARLDWNDTPNTA